jgi:hypothetical protein
MVLSFNQRLKKMYISEQEIREVVQSAYGKLREDPTKDSIFFTYMLKNLNNNKSGSSNPTSIYEGKLFSIHDFVMWAAECYEGRHNFHQDVP